VTTMNKV